MCHPLGFRIKFVDNVVVPEIEEDLDNAGKLQERYCDPQSIIFDIFLKAVSMHEIVQTSMNYGI